MYKLFYIIGFTVTQFTAWNSDKSKVVHNISDYFYSHFSNT